MDPETSARPPAAARPTRASRTSRPEAGVSTPLRRPLVAAPHSALSTEATQVFVLYLKKTDIYGQCPSFRIFKRQSFSAFTSL